MNFLLVIGGKDRITPYRECMNGTPFYELEATRTPWVLEYIGISLWFERSNLKMEETWMYQELSKWLVCGL